MLWPGAATASSPEVTDPIGDATPVYSACDLAGGAPCTDRPGSQPSIDIIEADLSTDGDVLLLTTTVLDIDSPDLDPAANRRFGMSTNSDDFVIVVGGEAGVATGGLWVYARDFNSGGYAVIDVETDVASDSVTFRVPLAALVETGSAACAECRSIGRGTQLHGLSAQTQLSAPRVSVGNWSDWASGDTPYRIGHA